MEGSRRDSTEEWLVPESAKPPLISELVVRIDEAVATARASEAAVMTVGAAALDAAEQARRAADLAERASAVMLGEPYEEDEGLREFTVHANRVAARLRALEGAQPAITRANGDAALERRAG
jgi:hypothetical protein